jgi:predicted nicotinamide N-methyase
MDSHPGIDDVGDAEPLSVLDLPQIYQRPSFESLLLVLEDLALAPPSWDVNPNVSRKRPIDEEGIPSYLTKIISSPLLWIESDDIREKIWEAASQRLSERSGRTGRADLTRTFNIPLADTDKDVLTITLHEPALQADNLGLKTWASSYLLAKRLRTLRKSMPTLEPGARVLELGAGTGLVGLAAAAVFQARVILTDLLEIVPNLQWNAATNCDVVSAHSGTVEVSILDWSKPEAFALASAPFSFPLILAADPIYSSDHPRLLVQAIELHLCKSKHARAVIELPLREAFADERKDLRGRMHGIGLKVLAEGEELGYDDWAQGNERAEVRCWWSVWGWDQPTDDRSNE